MLDQLEQSISSIDSGGPRTDSDSTFTSFVWICSSTLEDVDATLKRYVAAIETVSRKHELIVVSNGLNSDALRRLKSLLSEIVMPSSLVQLNRHCPYSSALTAGFQQTSGDVIVVLPSYAQCNPLDVARMLAMLDQGYDYVASWRQSRIDGPLGGWQSRFYNWVARRVSAIELHDINSGLRVMRRTVVDEVPVYGDLHVFLPILAARHGFRVGEAPVQHLEERASGAEQGVSVYLRRALDLLSIFFLLRFTQRPFRFFGGVGACFGTTGVGITAVVGIQRLLGEPLADRPVLILGALLIVLGIQMISVGLLGELLLFTGSSQLKSYYISGIFESKSSTNDSQYGQRSH